MICFNSLLPSLLSAAVYFAASLSPSHYNELNNYNVSPTPQDLDIRTHARTHKHTQYKNNVELNTCSDVTYTMITWSAHMMHHSRLLVFNHYCLCVHLCATRSLCVYAVCRPPLHGNHYDILLQILRETYLNILYIQILRC